jgi:hypothetical protein
LSGIIGDADSIVVSFVQKTIPTTATAIDMHLINLDSSTPTIGNILVDTGIASAASAATGDAGSVLTVLETSTTDSVRIANVAGQSDKFISYTIGAYLDSVLSTTRPAGTYTFAWTVKTFEKGNALQPTTTQTRDFTITVAATTAQSTTVSSSQSTAVLGEGAFVSGTLDSTVSALATSSADPAASIVVTLKNASGQSPALLGESITATTSIGQIGVAGGAFGRSVVVAYTGATTLQVRPDGTSGTAVINISTPSVTFAAKQMSFYPAATSTSSVVATKRLNTLKIGANSGAVTAVLKDAAGNVIGGNTSAYVFSDALTVVSETATACTYDTANSRHTCSLTGVIAGTANITIGTISKSVVSSAIAVTVSNARAASLKMEFDKASYAPGEKGYVKVWAVDSSGKPVAPGTVSGLLAGGISVTGSFTGTSDLPVASTVTDVALAQTSAAVDGVDSVEPIKLYTVYMPYSGGSLTITATGGSGLPVAGQVDVTAKATITNDAAAALAAVNALQTTVASLRTLITTLTNLVLKIQKKVKA